eukprot:Blabericola_migrator_1__4885@NODE_2555_length_2615_cov_406_735479_g1596_i0_p2_GENE_NODE_2555_length_2615_cov_406_735479_g1596_i0NODE_2555_length_2615_cov_406_735479_g1596_i0_p2_ORF_typecomplete_len189_score25_69_NODE_2555_length_2615_cov_406_735479_g1596_i019852551
MKLFSLLSLTLTLASRDPLASLEATAIQDEGSLRGATQGTPRRLVSLDTLVDSLHTATCAKLGSTCTRCRNLGCHYVNFTDGAVAAINTVVDSLKGNTLGSLINAAVPGSVTVLENLLEYSLLDETNSICANNVTLLEQLTQFDGTVGQLFSKAIAKYVGQIDPCEPDAAPATLALSFGALLALYLFH